MSRPKSNLEVRMDRLLVKFDGAEKKLDRLLRLSEVSLVTEVVNMALSQDILDAVAAETTVIDSFIALVQGMIDNNTIPPDAGAAILSAIAANKAKVEAAIVANTPPVV